MYVLLMIIRVALLFVAVLHLTSCEDATEVVQVTETRKLTAWDTPRGKLLPIMPPEWRQVPGTQMRPFNYRFGVDGEVYISNSRGGVLPNVNRWLKQYGKPEVVSVDSFEKMKVFGVEGVLVEATGKFGGGMGKLPRENAGLLGFMVDLDGTLLTVKMIGDAGEVSAERARFIKFCETLSKH